MFKQLLKRFMQDELAQAQPTPRKKTAMDMDVRAAQGWVPTPIPPNPIQLTVKDFPIYDGSVGGIVAQRRFGMDAATGKATIDGKFKVMDDEGGGPSGALIDKVSPYSTPPALQNWYLSQGFPGYQALSIMAQHWLVDKACSMAGNDAVRNGWTIRDQDGDEITGDTLKKLQALDTKFNISGNMAEMNRFNNIFGIRIAYFVVDSEDADYYEKPFNIDGITPNSYQGISQVDPYWMTPMLTSESTLDPSSPHFYDPEFWVISGRKFHRSHLIISRGPQPADILKPTYLFGGISLVQRIYERVYAAERTANEAPLLAMNKRTTAIHVDMDKAVANEAKFVEKIAFWVRFRDNHGVKVLGTEETMEQFDTSLADFDNVIMSQYQLVAAIAETPATKLLGTPPKGFNATGEFEMVSYHEKLETIQKNEMSPLLTRHYEIAARSLELADASGEAMEIHHVWEPVDSVSSEKREEINGKKAETAERYVNMGAISPDEVRQKLRHDRTAGYTSITDEEAQQTPGLSPENIAAFAEATAENVKAGAAAVKSEAQQESVEQGGGTNLQSAGAKPPVPGAAPGAGAATEGLGEPSDPVTPPGGALNPATAPVPYTQPQQITLNLDTNALAPLFQQLLSALHKIDDTNVQEGVDIGAHETNRNRTTGASVKRSTLPSVGGMSDVVGTAEPHKLPKMRMHGLNLAVENPRGSIRRGMRFDGTSWQAQMKHHYGYIKGVMGADGDELDCFIGPNLASTQVHVINQNNPENGQFDEHKVMLGFDSPEAAKEGYSSSFDKDWTGYDSMVSMDINQFRKSIAQKGLWASKLVHKGK